MVKTATPYWGGRFFYRWAVECSCIVNLMVYSMGDRKKTAMPQNREHLCTIYLPVVFDDGFEDEVDVDCYGFLIPHTPAIANCDPDDCSPPDGGYIDGLRCYAEHNGTVVLLDDEFCTLHHDAIYERANSG